MSVCPEAARLNIDVYISTLWGGIQGQVFNPGSPRLQGNQVETNHDVDAWKQRRYRYSSELECYERLSARRIEAR